MAGIEEYLDTVESVLSSGVDKGLGHQSMAKEKFNGKNIKIGNKILSNLGWCGYMGLEFDNRLKQAAKDAIDMYGTEHSSSRAYFQNGLYDELESLMSTALGRPCVVTPSTTLGHLSSLPSLISEKDAIILDFSAHDSLQVATSFLQSKGIFVTRIPYNSMIQLERKIIRLKKKYRNVWYVADGLHSMFGTFCNLKKLKDLTTRHEQLWLYLDDAHGLSWMGKHGRGFVLNELYNHPRAIVAGGMAKGWGSGGGVITCPDERLIRRIRMCGPTLNFSGPLVPSILGAAIESTKIHLSDELETLQDDFASLNNACNESLISRGIHLSSDPKSPIKIVHIGQLSKSHNIIRGLLDNGFLVNSAQFPATALKASSVRFCVTLLQDPQTFERFADCLRDEMEKELGAEFFEETQGDLEDSKEQTQLSQVI